MCRNVLVLLLFNLLRSTTMARPNRKSLAPRKSPLPSRYVLHIGNSKSRGLPYSCVLLVRNLALPPPPPPPSLSSGFVVLWPSRYQSCVFCRYVWWIYAYICVAIYVCVHEWLHMYIYIYIYICVCVCVCVCVFGRNSM